MKRQWRYGFVALGLFFLLLSAATQWRESNPTFRFQVPSWLIRDTTGEKGMPITKVKELGGGVTSVGTMSITIPAGGCAAGNRVIVSVGYMIPSATITVADSKGNSYNLDYNQIAASNGIWIFSAHIATALVEGDTIELTCSNTSSTWAVRASEFSGIASSSAVDKTAVVSTEGYNTTIGTATTATTAQADELVFAAAFARGGPGGTYTVNISTDYTLGMSANASSTAHLQPAHKIVSATGAQSATFAMNSSLQYKVGVVVTYKGDSGGGGDGGVPTNTDGLFLMM